MKAIIIAAGQGSRIKQISNDGPKCLIDILGLKIIDRIIKPLIDADINDIAIITGYESQKLVDYVSLKYPDIKFIYNKDWNTKANGVSVYCAKEFVGDDEFLLLMSDHLFENRLPYDVRKIQLSYNEACLVIDKRIDDIFDIDDATKVLIDEKKILKIHKKLDVYNAVDCGMFKCNKFLFDCLEKSISSGDESLSGGIKQIIEAGNMKFFDIQNFYWQDIDHFDGYKNAEKILLNNLIKSTDGILSRKVNRKISLFITKKIAGYPVTPNQISFIVFLFGILTAFVIGLGHRISGGILIQIFSIADGIDGEISRLKFQGSVKGAFLDQLFDRLGEFIIFCFLIQYEFIRTGSNYIFYAGYFLLLSYLIYYGLGNFAWFSGLLVKEKTPNKFFGIFQIIDKTTVNITRDVWMGIISMGVIFNFILPTILVYAVYNFISGFQKFIGFWLKNNE